MTVGTADQMRRVADRLDKLTAEIGPALADIAMNHGARIERAAKILTPVDTGALMGANRYEVHDVYHNTILTVSNRMIYAHYQHENVMNHPNKRTARDHFISIPFEKEVPRIVASIGDYIIKEAKL